MQNPNPFEILACNKKINYKTKEVKFHQATNTKYQHTIRGPAEPRKSNTGGWVIKPKPARLITRPRKGALHKSRQGTPKSRNPSNINVNVRDQNSLQPEVIYHNLLWYQVFTWAANAHRMNAVINL